MTAIIEDRGLEKEVIRRRQEIGADRWDEVWEGVYIMNPLPNPEHQDIVAAVGGLLMWLFRLTGDGIVFNGINYAADPDDWQRNYRCPDIAVFLAHNKGVKEYDTFYTGRADFLVEVVSPDDRVREKLPFYEKLRVHELLIIERDPWQLELFRYADGKLASTAVATVDNSSILTSERLGVTFQLLPGEKRPGIRLEHLKTNQHWVV